MFPNLNAEQARYGHSNEYVASMIGLKRCTYETKKRNGKFTMNEINALCEVYHCDYAYLFSASPITPKTLLGIEKTAS